MLGRKSILALVIGIIITGALIVSTLNVKTTSVTNNNAPAQYAKGGDAYVLVMNLTINDGGDRLLAGTAPEPGSIVNDSNQQDTWSSLRYIDAVPGDEWNDSADTIYEDGDGDFTFNSTYDSVICGVTPVDGTPSKLGVKSPDWTLLKTYNGGDLGWNPNDDAIIIDTDNNTVWRDELNAVTFNNTGTAVNGTDIYNITLWAETNGQLGFQTTDTIVGVATWDGDSWVISGLTYDIDGDTTFYVTVNISSGATDGATIIMKIPTLSDANSNGSYDAGDEGLFFASTDDTGGITNAYTITIDTVEPNSVINVPVDNAYYGPNQNLTNISGYATDSVSGVEHVFISIQNTSTGKYWNGTSWTDTVWWIYTSQNVSEGKSVTWWRTDLPAWADGVTYRIRSMAMDVAGNYETTYDSKNFTYDSSKPSSEVWPISGYWKTTSSININATASDTGSGVRDVSLYYYWSIDNTTWNGPFLWNTNITPWINLSDITFPAFDFPNGTAHYQFYTIAVDNVSNVEDAPTTNDTMCGYDVEGPNVTISTPVHGGFYGPNQNLTNITGQATDLAGVLIVNITICNSSTNEYWNGSAWVSTGPVNLTATLLNPNATTTGWYYNTLPVWKDNTAYAIKATATDILNNENTTLTLGKNWRTFTYDATPPTCTIEYNDPRDYYKAGDVIRIYANFTETVSGIDPTSVIINISTAGDDDLPNTSMIQVDNTHWYYDWTVPSGTDEDGTFTVSVYAKDNANNLLNPYPTTDNSKGIDNTPPSATLASISPYWQTSSPITVTVSASDALSGLDRVELYYQFTSDNSSWSGIWVSCGTNYTPWKDPSNINFTFNFPQGEGYYRLLAKVFDNATNQGTSNVEECGYDATAPTCTIEYNDSREYYRAGDVIRIYANFTETLSGIDPTSVIINISTAGDGDLFNTSMTQVDNTHWYYDWTIPSGSDEDGPFTVKVYAKDNAGNNLNPYPTTNSSKGIDNTGPTILVTYPNGGEYVRANVTITWTTVDANPNVVTIEYSPDNGGNWTTIVSNLADTGSYTWDTTTVADGSDYLIRVIATDKAGNTANDTSNNTFTVDNTPPVLNYSVLDADHDGSQYTYIDVYFYDANGLNSSSIDAADFDINNSLNASIDVIQVVGTSGTTGVTVTLKLNGYLSTSNSPKIVIVGDITDPAGNRVAIGSNVTINTFRIHLYPGWNLISIPAKNVNITELMETIKDKLVIVWSYDATEPNASNQWKSFYFIGDTAYGDLKDQPMEPGRGYWIKVTASCTLIGNYQTLVEADTSGSYPLSPPEITLKNNAWNLIGHFLFYKQAANTSGAFKCLEGLLSSNELLYYYDNPSGRYVQAYNDYMVPGKGYWLWISNAVPDGSKYTPAIS